MSSPRRRQILRLRLAALHPLTHALTHLHTHIYKVCTTFVMPTTMVTPYLGASTHTRGECSHILQKSGVLN